MNEMENTSYVEITQTYLKELYYVEDNSDSREHFTEARTNYYNDHIA